MTVIFFGSSDFSLQALKACLDQKLQVLLVVSTPDQKKGRGLKMFPTPVKKFSLEAGLAVETPERLKGSDCLKKIQELQPDLFVVSSYGKFIPSAWLKVPSKLALNVHPSLLPKYRGASPLNRPILNGDKETGVTIAEVTSKLDSGDIFVQERYAIGEDVDSEQLSHDLAHLSYGLLTEVLKQVETGTLKRTPQNDEEASYAEKLTKEDGKVSWKEPALELDRKIRGLKPWPGAYVYFQGELLQLIAVKALDENSGMKAGALITLESGGAIQVATGKGILKVLKVKPAGKKEMDAAAFIRGRRLEPGAILNDS